MSAGTAPTESEPLDGSDSGAASSNSLRAWNWRRWTAWERAIAAVGAMGVVFTVGFGIIELKRSNDLQREQNRQERAAMDSHLGELMMDVDRHFVAYPRVRRYFYVKGRKQVRPPRAGRLHAQALSTAEMLIDFADDAASYVRERKMPQDDAAHWNKIVSSYFRESPALRVTWRRYHDAYSPDTACILGAPPEKVLERRYRRVHRGRGPQKEWLGGCE
jgi:hypothetical protein